MKILIADDHKLFTEGISMIMKSLRPELIVDCVYDGNLAFQYISEQSFDLALIDLRLPGLDGFSLLKQLNEMKSLVPVIILSASENPRDVDEALALGARGFISKKESGQTVLEIIDRVLTGEVVNFLDKSLSAESINTVQYGDQSQWAKQHNITPRQLEVLRLISQGLSNKLIARELSISLITVKSHISAIFHSLEVESRSAAIAKAQLLGLD